MVSHSNEREPLFGWSAGGEPNGSCTWSQEMAAICFDQRVFVMTSYAHEWQTTATTTTIATKTTILNPIM